LVNLGTWRKIQSSVPIGRIVKCPHDGFQPLPTLFWD
jgi:hypothetical protein